MQERYGQTWDRWPTTCTAPHIVWYRVPFRGCLNGSTGLFGFSGLWFGDRILKPRVSGVRVYGGGFEDEDAEDEVDGEDDNPNAADGDDV